MMQLPHFIRYFGPVILLVLGGLHQLSGSSDGTAAERTTDLSPPAAAPQDAVSQLQDGLIEIMQHPGAENYPLRRDTIRPIVERYFNLPLISRLVLGNHWRQLSSDQQQSFQKELLEFMAASYASNFKDYAGQRFEIVDVGSASGGTTTARSRFIPEKGKTRRFDYQLRNGSQGWQILNIAVDGISDLSIKRSEFGDVMQKQGIDGLLQEIRQRTKTMADGD